MAVQPLESIVMMSSEPDVMASTCTETQLVHLKEDEQQDHVVNLDHKEEEENEEEGDKEEEEILQQKKTKKKLRRGRAKTKRSGRGNKNLSSSDTQATIASLSFMRKQRQDLTLGAKVKVLEMLEQDPKVPQGKIASMFRVSQSQVSRIMKNKEAIMSQWNQFATPDRKRCRLGKAGALEQKLIDWYKEAKKEDLPISGPILMEKAKSIGNEMGIEFKPSAGWLGRWKDRNGVTLKRFKDKDGTLSATKVGNHWRRYMFTKATKDYSLENIWVVDETVLAYNALLPEHLVQGGVSGNDKISIILACNLAGTERKPPVVIGNSESLNTITLPTPFQHHTESIITLDFFSSWLKEWDRELHSKRKKIVLLMSKMPHHPENPHVFNINVTFFPQDTSTVLQPLQLGIINVFKSLYRYQQLKYVMAKTQASEKIGLCSVFSQNILLIDSLSISLLDAIFMVYKAWRHVSPETIVKGVVKAGMSKDVDALNVCDSVQPPPGISQEDFEVIVNLDGRLTNTEHVEHQRLTNTEHMEQQRLTNTEHVEQQRLTNTEHLEQQRLTNTGHVEQQRLTNTEHIEHQPQTLGDQSDVNATEQFDQYLRVYGNLINKSQQSHQQIEVVHEAAAVSEYPSVSEAVYACQILRHYLQKQGGKLYDEFSSVESSIHLDMILDAKPDLRNTQLSDPLHDSSSVHSLEIHQAALEQKAEYVQKMQDELHQQRVQKEMKKVTQSSPTVYHNPHGSLNAPPQQPRTDLQHPHLLGIQRSNMHGQGQEILHQPVQHSDYMRQDIMRPEYRQEIPHDRSRNSLVELRSVNMSSFRPPRPDVRNEIRSDGKNDSMTLTSELKSLSSDNHTGVELHHHGMSLDHNIVRQTDARINNPGIPYYTLTNPLPHYMQSK